MNKEFSCVPYRKDKSLPWGFIHPKRGRCPFHGRRFADDDGRDEDHCCWLRVEDLGFNLYALGELVLSKVVRTKTGPSKARTIGRRLRLAAGALERQYCRYQETKILPGRSPTFDEAIETIRHGAAWFCKVGKAGCSVDITSRRI